MLIRGETTMANLPLPGILFKYREWGNSDHLRMLTDAEFMFERPYEMCPFSELQFETKVMGWNKLRQFYEDRVQKRFPLLNSYEQSVIIQREFKLSAYHNPKLVDREIVDLFNQFDGRFGALSLGSNNVSNRLWEDFALSGSGFCVGVDPHIIAHSSSHGGLMQYYKSGNKPPMNFPALNPDEYIDDIINT